MYKIIKSPKICKIMKNDEFVFLADFDDFSDFIISHDSKFICERQRAKSCHFGRILMIFKILIIIRNFSIFKHKVNTIRQTLYKINKIRALSLKLNKTCTNNILSFRQTKIIFVAGIKIS
eukprot:444348_1